MAIPTGLKLFLNGEENSTALATNASEGEKIYYYLDGSELKVTAAIGTDFDSESGTLVGTVTGAANDGDKSFAWSTITDENKGKVKVELEAAASGVPVTPNLNIVSSNDWDISLGTGAAGTVALASEILTFSAVATPITINSGSIKLASNNTVDFGEKAADAASVTYISDDASLKDEGIAVPTALGTITLKAVQTTHAAGVEVTKAGVVKPGKLAVGDSFVLGNLTVGVDTAASAGSTLTFEEGGLKTANLGTSGVITLTGKGTFLTDTTATANGSAKVAQDGTLTLVAGTYSAVKDGAAIETETAGSVTYTGKFTITAGDGGKVSATGYTATGGLAGVTAATASATVKSLTASDLSIANNTDTVVAKAENSTVSVAANGEMTLTGGSFYTGATVDVSGAVTMVSNDTEPKTLVSFAASSSGTYDGSSNAVTVTTGTASITSDFAGTTITANNVAYTTDARTTVATFAGGTNKVSNFTAGTVQFQTANGSEYIVGGNTIGDQGAQTTLIFASNGSDDKTYLVSGAAVKVAAGESIKIANSADLTKVTTITASGTNEVTVTLDGNGGYTIGGLDTAGNKVTVDNVEYETDTDTTKLKTTGSDTMATLNVGVTGTITIASGADEVIEGANVTGFTLNAKTFDGTQSSFDKSAATVLYYDAGGVLVATDVEDTNKSQAVVSITRSNTTAKDNYEVKATGAYTNEAIKIVDVSVSVTDTNGTNTYDLGGTTATTITANGTFSTDTAYTLTAATGTITVTKGSIKTQSGAAAYDISEASTDVIFVKGNALENTKVTVAGSNVITITEQNSEADTKVAQDGSIIGIDGDATIKGAVDDSTITTVNDGALTVSSTSGSPIQTYTVSGTTDGVKYTVDDGTAAVVSVVDGLDENATLTTEAKFTNGAITVNGAAFSAITSKNGVSFTGTGTSSAYITLDQKGETAKIGDFTVTVDAIGTGDSGVTVDKNGKVSGLSNGDTITVANSSSSKSVTYKVNNNILVVSDNAASSPLGDVTYNLDTTSGATSFTALMSASTATATVENGIKGQTVTGIELGGDKTTGTGTDITSVSEGMLIDKDGKITADSSKAVATMSMNTGSNTASYTTNSGSTAAQVVKLTNDASINIYDWTVTTQAGKDTIDYQVNANASINSGAGADNVTVSSNGSVSVEGGEGNDTLEISGGTGDILLSSSSGNNKLSNTGNTGNSTLQGGSGNDTITSNNANDMLYGGGGTNIFQTTGNVTNKIQDYTYGSDVVALTGVTTTLSAGSINVEPEGTISYGTYATNGGVDVSANAGDFYAVTLADKDGKNKQDVAWTKESGGSIVLDGSYTGKAILIGDKNSGGADLLSGGAGADTIYAGSGDSIYGGAGKNVLSIANNAESVVVGIGSSSKDSITGFSAGFDTTVDDQVYLVEGGAADVSFVVDTAKGLTMKDSTGSIAFTDIKTSTAEILVNGARVAAAAQNATIAAGEADYADFYFGTKNSAVTFGATADNVAVDLSDTNKYRNINTVVGGMGDTTLMGGSKGETLVSGNGDSSLWGGAGNDYLKGGTGADTFYFLAGDGRDTISGFTAGTGDNSDLLRTGAIQSLRVTDRGLEITTGGTDKVTVEKIDANSKIRWTDGTNSAVAKVGRTDRANTFTLEEDVTAYVGGGKGDKLTVSASDSTDHNVWLDGSQGTAYSGIATVDLSNSSGNVILAGDASRNQSLVGGKGDSSLWGGNGGTNDTLKGSSSGATQFFFNMGGGNDVVISSSANDSVNLFDVKLSDIKTADITNTGVSLELHDGSKLTVQTTRDLKFLLASGETFTANHTAKRWDV